MPLRDIVVVGASTGGLQALRALVENLPQDYPGTIFIVMHVGAISLLPEILARSGKVPVVAAENNAPYRANHIYVAPPNRHLVLHDGVMKLSAAPAENRHRPAIDPLFRTAARALRSRVVGVLLTGGLDDGSAGLFAIKARQGIAIVQDPKEAVAPEMPQNAINHVSVDYVLPLTEIPPLLVRLARTDDGSEAASNESPQLDTKDNEEIVSDPPPSETQISMGCPDCAGPLYEMKEGNLASFRCNVGHVYSALSLSAAHSEALERALWVAVRTLNERITLHRQMLKRDRNDAENALFQRLENSVKIAEQDVQLLRQIIEHI